MKKANKCKNYRRCISCRQVKPKKDFLRVVRTHPDHQILVNSGMGRSAYICPEQECLTIAKKQKKLSRALKMNICNSIYEKLQQEISDSE